MWQIFRRLALVVGWGCVACSGTSEDPPQDDGSGGGGQMSRPNCSPNVPLDCVADLCRPENRNCGDPSSVLDANGCYRAECATYDECAPEEDCREVTYSPVSCGYASPNDEQCVCGGLGNTLTEMRCFPR